MCGGEHGPAGAPVLTGRNGISSIRQLLNGPINGKLALALPGRSAHGGMRYCLTVTHMGYHQVYN